MLSAVSAWAGFTNDLIANYRLDGNGNDALGTNAGFGVSAMPFGYGSFRVDGKYEPNGTRNNRLSTPVLKSLNYTSFTVSLDFQPEPALRGSRLNRIESFLDFVSRGRYSRWVGLVDNRTDNLLTGGPSYRWIGFNRMNNVLNLTLNNQKFRHEFKNVPVGPDRWHHLACSFDLQRREVLTMFDGHLLETVTLPDNFKLEIIGAPDDATDREFGFVNYSNGSVYRGYAANLKVFGRALSGAELAELYKQTAAERPTFDSGKPVHRVLLLLGAVLGGALVLMLLRLRRALPAAKPATPVAEAKAG
jgi:hypothetical protein